MSIQIQGSDLQKAAENGMDEFLNVFINAYQNATGGTLNAETMPILNGTQHCLMSYHIFREEVMQGGFVQLIQNGYGAYIFHNPFAKFLKTAGMEELSKLVYKAREIYDANRAELERETNEDEFHAMYEAFEVFDELEERFFEIEEACTGLLACYVDEHLEDFAQVVESA